MDKVRLGAGDVGDVNLQCWSFIRSNTHWTCPHTYDVKFAYDGMGGIQYLYERNNEESNLSYDLASWCTATVDHAFAPPMDWDALAIVVSNRNTGKKGTVDFTGSS